MGTLAAMPSAVVPPCVVFFHAHPDDESIFTGGTLRLLADRGVRTVVIIATDGAGGAAEDATAGDLADRRATEARAACRLPGVDALHLLGYADGGGPDGGDRASLGSCAVAAHRLAQLLRDEGATAVVTYDDGGIYAHPDHLAVHRIGVAAAELAEVALVYEATVDREYLHFVETHLVHHAVEWLVGEDAAAVRNRAPLGVPTVVVSTTVDVGSVIDVKRSAIAAHRTQVPDGSPLHAMDDEAFRAVYGYEWFVRRGPRGPIEELPPPS